MGAPPSLLWEATVMGLVVVVVMVVVVVVVVVVKVEHFPLHTQLRPGVSCQHSRMRAIGRFVAIFSAGNCLPWLFAPRKQVN